MDKCFGRVGFENSVNVKLLVNYYMCELQLWMVAAIVTRLVSRLYCELVRVRPAPGVHEAPAIQTRI